MDLLNKVIKAAEQANPDAPGDYTDLETGMLICGNCHTPKTALINPCGQLVKVRILCECARKRDEEERSARRNRDFGYMVSKNRQFCFDNRDLKSSYTFSKDDGKNKLVMKMAFGYVDQFPEYYRQGKGILFFGPPGTGKTFAACCIANALLDKGYTVLVATFVEINARLQSTYDKKGVYDDLCRYDLLVLDDLGVERGTSYMDEVVFAVIDSRLASGKPMIVTSNLTSESFTAKDLDISKRRIYSRLYESCIPVEVLGKDRRLEKMESEIDADLQRILSGGSTE